MKTTILMSLVLCFMGTTTILGQETDLLAFNQRVGHQVLDAQPLIKIAKPNGDYLLRVKQQGQSNHISSLQQRAANFNIEELDIYSKSEASTYTVVLQEKNSTLHLKYNNDGVIIGSIERHKNALVPAHLRRKIALQFPGWSFEGSLLHVKYAYQKETSKSFKIHLKKGNERKVFKMVE